jgi:hypothetical protein
MSFDLTCSGVRAACFILAFAADTAATTEPKVCGISSYVSRNAEHGQAIDLVLKKKRAALARSAAAAV